MIDWGPWKPINITTGDQPPTKLANVGSRERWFEVKDEQIRQGLGAWLK